MDFFNKIMGFEKEIINKLLGNNTYLKIFSLIFAIMIFLFLNGKGPLDFGKFLNKSEYIEGISLKVVKDEGKIIKGLPDEIGINISGSESQITEFKSNISNEIVTVDLKGREDGNYKIEASEFVFNKDYDLTIEPVVKEYKIQIDTLTTVSYPIDIEYANQKKNEGLILKDPILEDTNVTFDIGMHDKELIGSVKVFLDLEEINITNKKQEYEYIETIRVYSDSGEIINTNTILPEIKVIQPFEINTITLPIKYEIINNNTGKYPAFICEDNSVENVENNTCTDEVEVYGILDKINELTEINYLVDLKDFTEEQPFVDAFPRLENGINIKGKEVKNVKVSLEEGTKKTINNVPVIVKNLNQNFTFNSKEINTINIELEGAKTVVNKLKETDITVYVDTKEITNSGVYTLTIETNIPDNLNYKLSQQTLEIEVKEK